MAVFRPISWLLVGVCGVALSCSHDDGSRATQAWNPASSSTSETPTTAGTRTTTATATTSAASTSVASTRGPGASSGDTPSSTTRSDSSGSDSTGRRPDVCDGIAERSLIPPTACDGPAGNTTTEVPENGLYSTSWFGCYFEDDGTIHEDPFDNCEFACGSQGLCPAGQDGPTCEANLRWFAADVDRYGCGGRIRVTNCVNGNSVVLVTLDRGPNCNTVEMPCGAPVLDMSHDAMVYLFEGGTYGGCEHQNVVVEPVDRATPLGPV